MSDSLTKDNVLFTVIGILLGFISGYLLHEVMAARQPPRLRPGMAANAQGMAGAAPRSPEGAAEGAAGAQGGAGAQAGVPPMQEIQQLREYVESHPEDAEAIRKLANLNFDIRNWQRALELYERYLKLNPKDADAISDVGFCYRELKQFDKALAEFRRAQVADPAHWQSFFNEVVVLGIDQTRFDDADKALARLRQMQPNNSDVEQLAAEISRRRAAP